MHEGGSWKRGLMWFLVCIIIQLDLVILLGVAFLGMSYVVVGYTLVSIERSQEVSRKIDLRKRHAIKTIQSGDGDIIDCIDIYKQPAFNHPALKNHTIQMTPRYDPITEKLEERKKKTSMLVMAQLWKKSGSCPNGTIPVRRIQKKDLFESNSVEEYGRKKPEFSEQVTHGNHNKYSIQPNHTKAVLLTGGFSYSGGKGDIRVYNPYVEFDDEYSTSRVSLQHGLYYDFECVESGWAVNPSVYGDKKTRLFVYWTADASKTTGCFDLTCPGFVQTSSEITLGAAIYPISVPGGLPYQITIYIYMDPYTGNWWVKYGETMNIGYWPSELFKMLNHGATSVDWGGEVYSSRIGSPPHTATAMGSGKFPDPIFGSSGFIKRIRVRQHSAPLKFPEHVYTYADEYGCYGVYYVEDYVDDPEFYYGGPGKNPMCP